MLVRPLPLLSHVWNICWFLKYLSCNPWKEKTAYEKKKILIANFIYDIHLFIIFFQPHFTLAHFDHFILCSVFVICCVLGFFTSGGLAGNLSTFTNKVKQQRHKKAGSDAVAERMGECLAQHFSHFQAVSSWPSI